MTTPHTSTAEQVLAEVASMNDQVEEAAIEAPGEDTGEEVELEEQSADAEPERRNLSWNDAIARVPPDIAKLMKNMQADYTRKTTALAEQRREFLREREALMKGKQALADDGDVPEYDPFNEASIQARIEREVSRRLREVLEPMEAEYQTMKAEDDYQRFLNSRPRESRSRGSDREPVSSDSPRPGRRRDATRAHLSVCLRQARTD